MQCRAIKTEYEAHKMLKTATFYVPDYPQDITSEALQRIMTLHPSQVVVYDTEKNLGVFEIQYSYQTNRGNQKQSIKEFFVSETCNDVAKCFMDWVRTYNQKYPYRRLANVFIESIWHYANAALG